MKDLTEFLIPYLLVIIGFLEIFFSRRIYKFLIQINSRLAGRNPPKGDLFGRIGLIIQGSIFVYLGILVLGRRIWDHFGW